MRRSCSAIANSSFWRFAPFLSDELRLKILFLKTHKSWPNLTRPLTFSEKTQWRKLRDRRDILTLFADKFLVREYVRKKIGSKFLTELYWAAEDPRVLPLDELPASFVLKANHGTRWNLFVRDKSRVDREVLVGTLLRWLHQRHPRLHCEWGYRNIRPIAFAEEFLTTRDGTVPPDYKFFVFDGTVRLIQVDHDRFTNHSRTLYDPEWNLLPVALGYPKGSGIQKPLGLEEMIWCAERCSGGMDFVRVDLYNVDGRIVFGELTNYPGGGLEPFTPSSYDTDLGRWWRLPPLSDGGPRLMTQSCHD